MNGYVCPACGFSQLTDPPRTADGGSYEICWPCGFEFGVTDDDLGYSHESWRLLWIERGMPWDSAALRPRPRNWEPNRQLAELLRNGGDR